MDIACPAPLFASLTAAERVEVERAAAVAGQPVEEFVRAAVLDAARDPFLAALDQAVTTVVTRDRIQHDYAR
ncbi:hypothetical protein EV284_6432 [Streptomyces sp. BK022]|uniref:hypothetical protein n=1 Tax=Streptomyces sp. BK022 TaxID=2512123 RepID=UPI00102A528A|nr:hypothetical protein [Streptomyces sp. BK022]RZU28266.1 hypothetical protein EV284_6432 [Streptomyces sp. BK022]